jgi:hypothetical protein
MKLAALTLALVAGPAQADPQTVCLSSIKRTLKDPASARVESFSRWEPKSFTDAQGSAVPANHYTLMVNAKNSFGGYAGAKLYDCMLTVDDKRVLRISSF